MSPARATISEVWKVSQVPILALFDVSAAIDMVDYDILIKYLLVSLAFLVSRLSRFPLFWMGTCSALSLGPLKLNELLLLLVCCRALFSDYCSTLCTLLTLQLFWLPIVFWISFMLKKSGLICITQHLMLSQQWPQCSRSLWAWMPSNRLHLNPPNMQFIWLGIRQLLSSSSLINLRARVIEKNLSFIGKICFQNMWKSMQHLPVLRSYSVPLEQHEGH